METHSAYAASINRLEQLPISKQNMSTTSNTSRYSSESAKATVVPPATRSQDDNEDEPIVLDDQVLPAQVCCPARRRGWTLDERRHELVESIYRLTRTSFDLTPPRPDLSPALKSETEAIQQLRLLNNDPELALFGRRLRALELVEADLNRETFKEMPIAHIVDDLFSRLDIALFYGQLNVREVAIGTSDYAGQAARTHYQTGNRVKITLSRPYYDEYLRENVSSHVRIWDVVTSVVHEMCHAYLGVLCGSANRGDVDYFGGTVEIRGHGVFFGQVTYIVQRF